MHNLAIEGTCNYTQVIAAFLMHVTSYKSILKHEIASLCSRETCFIILSCKIFVFPTFWNGNFRMKVSSHLYDSPAKVSRFRKTSCARMNPLKDNNPYNKSRLVSPINCRNSDLK